MYKYKLKGFILLTLLCTASCHSNVKEMVFPSEKMLQAQEYIIPELVIPQYIELKKDHLILSQSNPAKERKIFTFLTLPDLNISFDDGNIGRGGDEFILPMFCGSSIDSILYIWGRSDLMKIGKYRIDLEEKKLKLTNDLLLKKYETFNQGYILGDSIFIYNAMPGEFSIKKVNLLNGVLLKELKFKKFDIKELYYEPNRVIISSNDKYIAACYLFQKRIDIYDTDLALKTKIDFGDYDNLSKIRNSDFANVISCYANIYISDKYIYTLYRGQTRTQYKENDYSGDTIEVFDFEGTPIVKYSFDKSPVLFVVDEANRKLYGYNSIFENKIFVYNL